MRLGVRLGILGHDNKATAAGRSITQRAARIRFRSDPSASIRPRNSRETVITRSNGLPLNAVDGRINTLLSIVQRGFRRNHAESNELKVNLLPLSGGGRAVGACRKHIKELALRHQLKAGAASRVKRARSDLRPLAIAAVSFR